MASFLLAAKLKRLPSMHRTSVVGAPPLPQPSVPLFVPDAITMNAAQLSSAVPSPTARETGIKRARSEGQVDLPGGSRSLLAPHIARLGSASQIGAARRLLAAKATVSSTRNPAISLAAAGASAAFAALSGGEAAATLDVARKLARVDGTKEASYLNAYATFVNRTWPGLSPFPVTRTGLMAYYADYVVVRKLSADSLKRIHTAIKTAARALGLWGVSPDDEAHLLDTRSFLVRAFPTEVRSGRSFTVVEMEAFLAATHDGSEDGALARAIFAFCVGAQARFTEVMGMWLSDVTFTPNGVLVDCVLDKQHKRTLTPSPRVCPVPPLRFRHLDGQQHLLSYLVKHRGWHASTAKARSREPLFTGAGGAALTDKSTRELLLRYLRAGNVSVGGTHTFDVHFGRATGLNFWAHACFIPRPIVEAAGGWEAGTVVKVHYVRRTTAEMSSVFRLNQIQVCRDLKWDL
jgi:integrase